MRKGLVCDVKRYLTPLAPELQRNTSNYQWQRFVVDIKISASRAATSGSRPLVMSPTPYTLFPPTHICLKMGEHLSWCVSETCKALILKRKSSHTAWTWWMIFPFGNFSRLSESGSFFPARLEIWCTVYTFKGLSIIHLIQIHVLMGGSWPGTHSAGRVKKYRGLRISDVAVRCPCFLLMDEETSSPSGEAAPVFVDCGPGRPRGSFCSRCLLPTMYLVTLVSRSCAGLAPLQAFFVTSLIQLVFSCII